MSEPRPLAKRLFWFVGLWVASVAALAVLAWIIRALLPY
jgi:hypothetical protein